MVIFRVTSSQLCSRPCHQRAGSFVWLHVIRIQNSMRSLRRSAAVCFFWARSNPLLAMVLPRQVRISPRATRTQNSTGCGTPTAMARSIRGPHCSGRMVMETGGKSLAAEAVTIPRGSGFGAYGFGGSNWPLPASSRYRDKRRFLSAARILSHAFWSQAIRQEYSFFRLRLGHGRARRGSMLVVISRMRQLRG